MRQITVQMVDGQMRLTAGELTCLAAIGRNGLVSAEDKIEGDGMTPVGTWPLRAIFYRSDHVQLPACTLKNFPITPEMGWCDDPQNAEYNRLITLPFEASHEVLWRDDSAYDLMIPLGYNDTPPIAPRGSAIFFHLLHHEKNFTDGCVAIGLDDMLAILPMITSDTQMLIAP